MGIGALERQQDVGRNRHQFETDEQEHEIVGNRRQGEAGQQDQKRARLLAGAAGVEATAAEAATTGDGAAEQVARLHEGEDRPECQHHPADVGREGVDADATRRDPCPFARLSSGHQHRREDTYHGHGPAAAESGEGAAQKGDQGRGHENDLGAQQEKALQ